MLIGYRHELMTFDLDLGPTSTIYRLWAPGYEPLSDSSASQGKVVTEMAIVRIR